jgi:hypothetical protein
MKSRAVNPYEMGDLKRGLKNENAVCPKILFTKFVLIFQGNITSFADVTSISIRH